MPFALSQHPPTHRPDLGHRGDNTGKPYNIGDSTLSAEGLRLIAEHLTGSKSLLALASVAAPSLSSTKAVAVRDGAYYW